MDESKRAGRIVDVQQAQGDLVAHLAGLSGADADGSRPSALPGWTWGHVLTHVARNADSLVRILVGVERGERLDQYEGGMPARSAAIEAGAGRGWTELVEDVRDSNDRLSEQLTAQRRWEGAGVGGNGAEFPVAELPFRRWREVLVHHADLGDPRFTATDWPDEYVREELRLMTMLWASRRSMGATQLPAGALAAPPRERLQWLLGRTTIVDLEPAGVF